MAATGKSSLEKGVKAGNIIKAAAKPWVAEAAEGPNWRRAGAECVEPGRCPEGCNGGDEGLGAYFKRGAVRD